MSRDGLRKECIRILKDAGKPLKPMQICRQLGLKNYKDFLRVCKTLRELVDDNQLQSILKHGKTWYFHPSISEEVKSKFQPNPRVCKRCKTPLGSYPQQYCPECISVLEVERGFFLPLPDFIY